jgi:hypothetical protein
MVVVNNGWEAEKRMETDDDNGWEAEKRMGSGKTDGSGCRRKRIRTNYALRIIETNLLIRTFKIVRMLYPFQ